VQSATQMLIEVLKGHNFSHAVNDQIIGGLH
jgi:hypothetical protein